jgi:hypothetical protein
MSSVTEPSTSTLGKQGEPLQSAKLPPHPKNSPRPLRSSLGVLCVKLFALPFTRRPASDYSLFVTFSSQPITTQRPSASPHLIAFIGLAAPKNRLQFMKLSPTFYVFIGEDKVKLNVAEH